jgi:hypothetical protein
MLVLDYNQRKHPLICLLVLGFLLPLPLSAGEFWTDKPYSEWSPAEVIRLLGNSPWARTVNVAISVKTQVDPASSSPEVVAPVRRIQHQTCCRTIEKIEAGPSSSDSNSQNSINEVGIPSSTEREIVFPARLVWLSSNTIRRAMLRQRALQGAPMAGGTEALAPSSEFVIAISGQFLRLLEGIKPEELKGKTFLTARKGSKKRLPVGEYIPPQGGEDPMAFLIFPKNVDQKPVFTKEDGELELAMTGPDFKLESRFPLEPMLVRGVLDW